MYASSVSCRLAELTSGQDEDWEEDDPLGDGVGEFDYLSCESCGWFRRVQTDIVAWLDSGAGENDAQDDDEDLKTDPIAQIDLGVSLLYGLAWSALICRHTSRTACEGATPRTWAACTPWWNC